MTDFRIGMTDELVEAIGNLPALALYDLHVATTDAAAAIERVMAYPRCGDELEEILEHASDYLRRIGDLAATSAPEAEATTDQERDRKAELMLRHLFDMAQPGLLSATAAAVCAGLTCGHVDPDFYVEGGWKRANDETERSA